MRTFVLSIVLSIGFLGLSVTAMRRRIVREQAALLWLGVSFVMVFLSATLPLHLLDRMARLVGVDYPPDLLLLLAVLFLFVLVFHLTTSIDRLAARQVVIVQELGISAASPPRPDSSAATEESDGPGRATPEP